MMLRTLTSAAGVCLLGATALMPASAEATSTSEPELRVCANIPMGVPADTTVQVSATNPSSQIVETFTGPDAAPQCKSAIEVVSGTYVISAAILQATCPAWSGTCHVPKFSFFTVQRESGPVQRIFSNEATANITPGESGDTTVTAVITAAD